MPISLRLPDDVKKRVVKLAEARDTTAHAFMLEAIREKLEAEEVRAVFHAEAERRLARMKKSRRGLHATEVFDYLDARAHGKTRRRPKPRRIA